MRLTGDDTMNSQIGLDKVDSQKVKSYKQFLGTSKIHKYLLDISPTYFDYLVQYPEV